MVEYTNPGSMFSVSPIPTAKTFIGMNIARSSLKDAKITPLARTSIVFILLAPFLSPLGQEGPKN
jgi:hypothetical protein